jgi:hypothetical protein
VARPKPEAKPEPEVPQFDFAVFDELEAPFVVSLIRVALETPAICQSLTTPAAKALALRVQTKVSVGTE